MALGVGRVFVWLVGLAIGSIVTRQMKNDFPTLMSRWQFNTIWTDKKIVKKKVQVASSLRDSVNQIHTKKKLVL